MKCGVSTVKIKAVLFLIEFVLRDLAWISQDNHFILELWKFHLLYFILHLQAAFGLKSPS